MTMPPTVTELAEEVRESNRHFSAAIDGLREETKELRVEVAKINNSIGWFKSIGAIVAGSAFAMLILVGTGIYRFGHVEAEITGLGNDMNQLKRDMDQVKRNMTELRDEFRARDDRLGRVLDRIEKALPPAPKERP